MSFNNVESEYNTTDSVSHGNSSNTSFINSINDISSMDSTASQIIIADDSNYSWNDHSQVDLNNPFLMNCTMNQ